MRFNLPATAVSLWLLPVGPVLAGAPQAPRQANPAPPASVPAPAATPDGNFSDAARHAKRTACRKEAKAKKLVGVRRNTYIKNCVAGT